MITTPVIAVSMSLLRYNKVDVVLMRHREQGDPERVQQPVGTEHVVGPSDGNDTTG